MSWLSTLAASVYDLMNMMWWGVLFGIVVVGFLSRVPREFVIAVLGRSGGMTGILRATCAGLLLDVCNHGILMIGAKLYERGASIGQVIAFLVASPWNSFSLTLILIALIGLPWTIGFIVLSMMIGIISGYIFEKLVARKVLPANPNKIDLPKNFKFWREAKKKLAQVNWTPKLVRTLLIDGVIESRMVLRWLLFGVILASLVRTFVDAAHFQTYFGPTLMGLGLTVLAATVIEVCSEGSAPIATDLLNRALAPGNAFTFLMTGVSTDYTEIMVLRDVTKSWKIALFLPLVTVPQIILLGYILNNL